MDFLRFCTQDRNHVIGSLVVLWMLFEGLKGLILAARGRDA
jgi:hypothetical protein